MDKVVVTERTTEAFVVWDAEVVSTVLPAGDALRVVNVPRNLAGQHIDPPSPYSNAPDPVLLPDGSVVLAVHVLGDALLRNRLLWLRPPGSEGKDYFLLDYDVHMLATTSAVGLMVAKTDTGENRLWTMPRYAITCESRLLGTPLAATAAEGTATGPWAHATPDGEHVAVVYNEKANGGANIVAFADRDGGGESWHIPDGADVLSYKAACHTGGLLDLSITLSDGRVWTLIYSGLTEESCPKVLEGFVPAAA